MSGGVAAVKTPLVASALIRSGCAVDAVLTEGATAFTTPLALSAVTGRRAYVAADLFVPDGDILHVRLAHEAEVAVVVPATAAFLARLAQGQASDLLVATLLGFRGKLLLAPAMEEEMWRHPAVQANVAVLQGRGAVLVGPVRGRLASGAEGEGRMAEPDEIVREVLAALQPGDLAGVHVVVTAGPTREHIDDVRYITNGSSGKMGFAIARAAAARGARVTLVTGPSDVPEPPGVAIRRVESAAEMLAAVQDVFDEADVFIGAAAVADLRPAGRKGGKVPKGDLPSTLAVEGTPDILRWVGEHKGSRKVVGFAAQMGLDVERAREKLASKHLDLIVLNDLGEPGAGFRTDTNHVLLLGPEGDRGAFGGSKLEVAHHILDVVAGSIR